jgi:hypothetical protein
VVVAEVAVVGNVSNNLKHTKWHRKFLSMNFWQK